jgi:hypothetical protein
VTTRSAPPGASSAAQTRSARTRILEVLEHVDEHDGVEAAGRRGIERSSALADVEPEHVARGMRGGRRGRLEALHLPAPPARLVQQEPVPAARLQQPPGADVALQPREQPPRRRPRPASSAR